VIAPPTPCRNGAAGHPSADGGQLLPGPTTALGSFFAVVDGAILLDAGPHIGPSDSLHCGLFLRDVLMLHYGLHYDHHSSSMGFYFSVHFLVTGFQYGLHLFLAESALSNPIKLVHPVQLLTTVVKLFYYDYRRVLD
jgi:hypothetical protein